MTVMPLDRVSGVTEWHQSYMFMILMGTRLSFSMGIVK